VTFGRYPSTAPAMWGASSEVARPITIINKITTNTVEIARVLPQGFHDPRRPCPGELRLFNPLAVAFAVDTAPRDADEAACQIYKNLGIRSIVVSANIDATAREALQDCEPMAFVAKPFRPTELDGALKKLSSSNKSTPVPLERP
jgi:hypothetical protein